MVKYSEEQINDIFSGLADPTRRDIIHRLIQKELAVSEIAGEYKISMPAVSKHLRVLEKAELVFYTKKGREKIYGANPKAILEIQRYIDFYTRFWSDKFDKLADYFEKKERKEDK